MLPLTFSTNSIKFLFFLVNKNYKYGLFFHNLYNKFIRYENKISIVAKFVCFIASY